MVERPPGGMYARKHNPPPHLRPTRLFIETERESHASSGGEPSGDEILNGRPDTSLQVIIHRKSILWR